VLFKIFSARDHDTFEWFEFITLDVYYLKFLFFQRVFGPREQNIVDRNLFKVTKVDTKLFSKLTEQLSNYDLTIFILVKVINKAFYIKVHFSNFICYLHLSKFKMLKFQLFVIKQIEIVWFEIVNKFQC